MNREDFNRAPLKPVLGILGVLPVDFDDDADFKAALRQADHELMSGRLVVLFPEKRVSRSGFLGEFHDFYSGLAKRNQCPIIPLYIDFMRGSRQRVFGGNSVRMGDTKRAGIRVMCGDPAGFEITPFELRRKVEELSSTAYEFRKEHRHSLGYMMVRNARRNWSRPQLADTTGLNLSYGKTLIGSLALSRAIGNGCKDERMIGILLPASAGAALVNIAVTLAGKIPVNLNFTAASENVEQAAKQCGLRTVFTSRRFMSRMKNLAVPGKAVYLEDVMASIRPRDRLNAALRAMLVPARLLTREWSRRPDDCATIVFSSGSTNNPKGIVLTHHNIISNIEQMHSVIDLDRNDCLCGILPFFHSFGLTGTLWFPLLAGFRAVYHPNPLDGSTIATTVCNEKATILLVTPAFLQIFMRKAAPADLASLRIVIAGAEKLKPALANVFWEKFGIVPLEGYGATELSPVAGLNMLDATRWGGEKCSRIGTVGRLPPGMCARIVDPETKNPVDAGRPGLLFLKGPNVMQGYLNLPDATSEALSNGWYCTGDIAQIANDGFITLTDRLARFSKIGGEMVPHGAIEDVLASALGSSGPVVAVTAAPDEHRGEKIIVVYTQEAGPVETLRTIMEQAQVPNLWKPASDAYLLADAIPMLGTGKTDLKALRNLACSAMLRNGAEIHA